MNTRMLVLSLSAGLLAMIAPVSAKADKVPEKYQETVDRGLEYLARQQHEDGHWEGDDGQHPVAMTALVGRALLMEGEKRYLLEPADGGRRAIIREKTHSAQVLRAADWLLKVSASRKDGLIYSGHPSETDRYMDGHGLALFFLCWVVGQRYDLQLSEERREKIVQATDRGFRYTVKARSSLGGWYHTSCTEGHDLAAISSTVIQLQGFQFGELALLSSAPPEVLLDAKDYLKTTVARAMMEKKSDGSLAADLAGTLQLLCFPSIDSERAERVRLLKFCAARILCKCGDGFEPDELAHDYYTMALLFAPRAPGDETANAWNLYRSAMFDYLKRTQNKDGSWSQSKTARGALGVGPVYATALWCSVLQLDNWR